MVLRSVYAPVLPEMDTFLFASVGEEVDGIPLSVLSALAQLGLDPRNEAARLSQLTSKAAANQLARMFARLPDRPWTSPEIRRVASRLVELLPAASKGGSDQVAGPTSPKLGSMPKLGSIAPRHLIYVALALSGALVFAMVTHGYVTSDGHEPAPRMSQADPATPFAPLR